MASTWLLGECNYETKWVDGFEDEVERQAFCESMEECPTTYWIAPAGREEERYWQVLKALQKSPSPPIGSPAAL